MVATLEDLKLELWFRLREQGKITWKTRKGDSIPINQMSDTHLVNCIRMLERNEELEEIAGEYDAYMIDKLYNGD